MKTILLILAFLLITLYSNANDSIRLKIKVPDVISIGNNFKLQYTINAECTNFQLAEEIRDFKVLFGPLTNRSKINGKSESIFSYILISWKEGVHRIPGASVKVKDKVYICDGLEIKVLPEEILNNELREESDSSLFIFVKQEALPKTVAELEPAKVSYKIYTKKDITQIHNLKYPAFDGCWIDEKSSDSNVALAAEKYNGINYFAAVIKEYTLYPLRPGDLIIDDFSLDLEYKVETDKKVETFFGEQPVYDSKRSTLYVDADTIGVAPLSDNAIRSFKPSFDEPEKIFKDKSEIVLAIDISSSMLAEDFIPNRLEATKNIIKAFQNKLPDAKTGLILFAGKSYSWTANIKTLVSAPDYKELVPDSLFKDGTAIGMGLLNSMKLLNLENSAKCIVLITDGADNSGNLSPLTAADIARQKGINIFIIAMGGIGKARLPVKAGAETVYVDFETKVDENTLRKMALMTRGKYFHASDNKSFDAAVNKIIKLLPEAKQPDTKNYEYITPQNVQHILNVMKIREIE